MKPKSIVMVGITTLIVLATLQVGATTVTFRRGLNGYTGVADSYVQRDYNDTPASYAGAFTYMYQGVVSGVTVDWPILRFDLSSLPPGTSITAATLTLTGTGTPAAGTYNLYPFYATNADWVENQATHVIRKTGGNWLNSSGGSLSAFDASPYPYNTGTLLGSYSLTGSESAGATKTITFTPAGIAAIQAWVNNPSLNAGFAMIESVIGNPAWTIASSEYGTDTYRPTLQLTYVSAPNLTLISSQNVSCNGDSDGGITIAASGGGGRRGE